MKAAFSVGLALLALSPVRAQVFRPEAVNGALLGGIAGAVIGNNSGDLRHNAWKGAAIGAGAGLLLGEAIGNTRAARTDTRVGSPDGTFYRESHRPSVSVGVGYSNHGYRGGHHRPGYYGRGHAGPGHPSTYYGSYGSGYGSYPAYGYYDGYGAGYPYYDSYGYGTYRGSAAGSGLLLGALAGGIIGHNSGDFHHNGWRGAAWGAGAGWLPGTIADASRPRVSYPQPTVVQQAPIVQAQPATHPPAAQPVTIINNYYNTSTPMSTANGMFGR